MPTNLKNQSLLSLDDLSADQIRFLLRLAAELKSAKHCGTEQPRLTGKTIALIFEKDSTRTRTGFEVAAYDQGAHVTYLGPTGSQIGHKETIKDTARVKMRDQQRLAAGPLKEYSQFGEGIPFGEATPRAGNDSGGGQPGSILKCKGWEEDPNAYTYFIIQAAVWEKVCDVIGEPEWKTKEGYATPPERLDKLNEIFERIEEWTKTKTKFEVMDICNPHDIPVGPILSMKEISEDEGLFATGTMVKVDHPERGEYLSVGCPIKLSDSPAEVKRSPLLGEHTEEILTEVLGYSGDDLDRVIGSGAVGEIKRDAAD